jgi:Ataxin-3
MKDKPEPISTTYLESFIAQLQASKYSIFVVVGEYPSCEAEFMLESSMFTWT